MERCDFSNHEELERYVDEMINESDALAIQAFSRILALVRGEYGTAES